MKYCNFVGADNFNDLFKKAINVLDSEGEWTEPRGFKCKEIISPQLVLTNPKNCLVTLEDRKLNYAYLIVEKFSYLSQISVPHILIAYNAQMKNYLNQDTGDFDGAYGPRIAKNSQLEYCYKQLLEDKDSRQAVITINDYTDRKVSKDKPCTLTLQFLIRENKLDMIVNMRSNDILWGFCLDVPCFAFIQEAMAFWLGIDMGIYIHQPASFHYYDNFEEKILSYKNSVKKNKEKNPKWNISFDDTHHALMSFWMEENNIRLHGFYIPTKFDCINEYLERLLNHWINKKNYGKKI
jgi:thymidylate synthase